MIRSEPLTMHDTPIADRWNALGDAIDAHGRNLDRIQDQHRANMIARYGLPDDHFTAGPARICPDNLTGGML